MAKSKKNLTRFDYDSTGYKGWRMSKSAYGHQFVRYFSDAQYGGNRKACAAAKACLRAVEGELEKCIPSTRRGAPKKQRGVYRRKEENTKTGKTYEYWVACWTNHGKRVMCKFSIAKLGELRAKQKAIEARKVAEENLGIKPPYQCLKPTDVQSISVMIDNTDWAV